MDFRRQEFMAFSGTGKISDTVVLGAEIRMYQDLKLWGGYKVGPFTSYKWGYNFYTVGRVKSPQ